MEPRALSWLADAVLVTHCLFVLFVIAGLAILAAARLRPPGPSFARSATFRGAYAGAVLLVAAQAWLGVPCFLTTWEQRLRLAAGEAGYAGSFIQHWLHRLLYWQAEPWVFTLAYTVLFILGVALCLGGGRQRN